MRVPGGQSSRRIAQLALLIEEQLSASACIEGLWVAFAANTRSIIGGVMAVFLQAMVAIQRTKRLG
jgi:hypothetical protein